MKAFTTRQNQSALNKPILQEQGTSKWQSKESNEQFDSLKNHDHSFGNMVIYPPAIQPKLSVNQPGDIYEQEADAMADKVVRSDEANPQQGNSFSSRTTPLNLQRKCKECEEEEAKGLQRKEANNHTPVVSPAVRTTLSSSGKLIDTSTRSFMEARFDHDFSNVRIHTDALAQQSATDINALAYTHQNNIVFAAGAFSPGTINGKKLLAHELTHVIQQNAAPPIEKTKPLFLTNSGNLLENNPVNPFAAKRNTAFRTSGILHSSANPDVVRRQERPTNTGGTSVQIGIIPIREFIGHVETIERAYPTKTPQEILTMIRSLYYGTPAGSPGFDRLIPDAPSTGAVEMCTDSEGSRCEQPVGTCQCVYATGLAITPEEMRPAIARLRQHADENEVGDNPSPYILVGRDLIDVGHLLVGVDAILHPRTSDPFASHGLTSAPGPATWEGDVGAGMVYLAEHQAAGRKSPDVKGNPSPTVESYYHNSAPMSDILGDVDAFGMASLVGPQTLSTALRYYYVSESGGSPRYQYNRWANFCSTVGLSYTENNGVITWAPAARTLVMNRIIAFANLFQGRTSPITAMTLGITPGTWPNAGAFADLFLADVKRGLEQEIASHAPAHP